MAKTAKRKSPPPAKSYCKRAVRLGALHAKIIEPAHVPTAEWVRLKCQYGCGGYGERLTCPPRSPTPDQTRRLLDGYRHILLIHTARGGMAKKIAAELEREAFLDGHYKAFALGCGPCSRCKSCKLEKGCVHPRLARPAMEACGIDVFATARGAGLPLETVATRDETANYYSLLLIE